MARTAAGQRWQSRIVSADQCFLFLAPPTLDLPFRSHGVFDALENLLEHQSHRPARRRVAVEYTCLVFSDTLVQAGASRSDIVRAVGTAQDVKVSVHKRFAGSALCVLRDAAC